MSTDYAKKERAFLDALEADTGHTLEAWLAMIDAELLEERNDIIDWLRQHGFTFSRASWIERIHHNGGQPIYANAQRASGARPVMDEPPPRLAKPLKSGQDDVNKADQIKGDAERAPSDAAQPAPSPSEQKPKLRVVATNTAPSAAKAKPSPDENTIEQTLARAKGLRPLAQHILSEIKTVVPDVKISTSKSALVFLADDTPFGLLALSAKDLRLGLTLASDPPQMPFEKPQFLPGHARISENITHMLVVDDVRQITSAVLSGVQNAATAASNRI